MPAASSSQEPPRWQTLRRPTATSPSRAFVFLSSRCLSLLSVYPCLIYTCPVPKSHPIRKSGQLCDTPFVGQAIGSRFAVRSRPELVSRALADVSAFTRSLLSPIQILMNVSPKVPRQIVQTHR